MIFDLLLTISEKSRLLSQKCFYQDNLIDLLLIAIEGDPQYKNICSEILSNLLQACGNRDLRSKFVITLQGVARVLQALRNSEVKDVQSDDDLELFNNLLDILSVCLLDGEENCCVFQKLQGYEYLVQELMMSKFLRRDALKLLSSILAVCSPDHVLYLV